MRAFLSVRSHEIVDTYLVTIVFVLWGFPAPLSMIRHNIRTHRRGRAPKHSTVPAIARMSSLLAAASSIEPFRSAEPTEVGSSTTMMALNGAMNDISPKQQPRRNLTKAFDALCISSDETVKEEKSDVYDEKVSSTMLSPVSVLINATASPDLLASPILQNSSHDKEISNCETPNASEALSSNDPLELDLHPDLRLKLTPFTVRRVASYSIIHDINKEALVMAAYDPLNGGGGSHESSAESLSPLVAAGLGQPLPEAGFVDASVVHAAVIDEEKWLLSSISSRSSHETAAYTSTQCPATFLQAMGEKEYDLSSASTRTQLWKPSRSWWEAKSGKNPWIEPASHNKRWRYLWPLIHYHKFLHKCIKKLRRNGVDVKVSVSPVSVFLREEVCAISDHLAAVSLFGSEEWMDCLQHFNGWTDVDSPASVSKYQRFVLSLPLRTMQEPIDVDSPLLRNQIDEAFLRTIALQREQLRDSVALHPPSSSIASSKKTRHGSTTTTAPTTATAVSQFGGPPPVYPRVTQGGHPVPKQIHGVRRSRYYGSGGWYPHPMGYENLPIDASSVHSELSANSYPQPHHHHLIDTAQYMHHGTAYYHPSNVGTQSTDHSNAAHYGYPEHYAGGWMDPAGYAMHYMASPQYYSGGIMETSYPSPTNEEDEEDLALEPCETQHFEESTPYKYGDADTSYAMLSPAYWSHLDQATLAMGLATPAMVSPSTTPRRTVGRRKKSDGDDITSSGTTAAEVEYPTTTHCAPLLLPGHRSYYGPNSRPRHVVPPSPATQFMMSPQASFAYSYGYGYSPNRGSRSGNCRPKLTAQPKTSNTDEPGTDEESSYHQVTPLTDGKTIFESPVASNAT
jgi:hypothetical protein